jgi:hypothetical protein
VDHALRVRVGEAARRLNGDVHRLGHRQRPGVEPLLQGLPLEKLQHEKGPLRREPDVVQRHQVRVGEPGHQLRLSLQLLPQPGLADPQQLQRHRPLQLHVLRLVDHAEAAAPQLAHQLEPPHHRAGLRLAEAGLVPRRPLQEKLLQE